MPSRRRLASQARTIRSGASPSPAGSEVPKRHFVASTTSSRWRASHGASVSSEPPSEYVSAVSTNVPPAVEEAVEHPMGLLARRLAEPMSIVPRHRRLTVSGPRVVVSICGYSYPRVGLRCTAEPA